MITIPNATISRSLVIEDGCTFLKYNIKDVYECEVCGERSTFLNYMIDHEKKHARENHKDEAYAGIL